MSTDTTDQQPSSLVCRDVTIAIAGRVLVDGLEFQIGPGDFVAVLGPNGVGKTLSLLSIAGLRNTERGEIEVGGDALRDLRRPAIARRLGLMLQHQSDPFPSSVLETALLGRHARNGIWHWETAEDRELARSVLRRVDLAGLEQRAAATLSGGERRRLALATLLMQDPALMLLDEPLNHLDPQHRFTVLACLAQLCRQGKAVMASLHDTMLAEQYASHALLLHGNGRWYFGPASEMLTEERLQDLYQTPFATVRHAGRRLLLPVAPPDLTIGNPAQ